LEQVENGLDSEILRRKRLEEHCFAQKGSEKKKRPIKGRRHTKLDLQGKNPPRHLSNLAYFNFVGVARGAGVTSTYPRKQWKQGARTIKGKKKTPESKKSEKVFEGDFYATSPGKKQQKTTFLVKRAIL